MADLMPQVPERTQDTSIDKTLDTLSDDTRVRVLKEFIIELIQGGYPKSKKDSLATIYYNPNESPEPADPSFLLLSDNTSNLLLSDDSSKVKLGG